MKIACLDLEGVLVPEIWINVAERTGIEALRRTTRDEPDYDRLMKESGADILSPYHPRLKRADVTRFRQRGVPVLPWTVNSPRAIRRFIEWGVDGIISDYPDRVLAILDKR